MTWRLRIHLWLCIALSMLAQVANANCERTAFTETEDWAAAPISFGRINLTSPSDPVLQPDGMLLASIIVPPTNYTARDARADSVMWRCDKADLDSGQVYFLVSTNGDSRYGGHNDIGRADGLVDVYATWFRNIGLRLSMEGVNLTRYWKKIPLKSYTVVNQKGKAKVEISLNDIPPLHAELYRVSQEEVPEKGQHTCSDPPKSPQPNAKVIPYTCLRPAGYIQLYGPGIHHDEEGEDHDTHYDFWGADNGVAYSLTNAITLSNTPTCMVRSATQHVSLGAISVRQLETGAAASAEFNIVVDCNQDMLSGTGDGQTAIGLQVSPGAFSAAQKLGLVHDGGVEFLLSDQYGSAPFAKGAGIRLYDAGGHQRRFVGQPGSVGKGYPQGPAAGWYPVMQDASSVGVAPGGDSQHQLRFTAKLMQVPGWVVTPGKVRATAHVLVRVQ